MEYRPMGQTGMNVSEIGFGCGNVGGLLIRGSHDDQVKAVARAMELGINYFDTASSYGDGQSETNLGKVLRELNAPVYVGTKYRLFADDGSDLKGGVVRSVEASLSRMGRDNVDLIQLHNRVGSERDLSRDVLTVEDVLGEVSEAVQTLRSQGKITHWGLTGVGETPALHRIADSGAMQTIQTVYSLLNPSAAAAVGAEFDMPNYDKLIDRAAAAEMGVIGIRVLAAGALAGFEQRHPMAAPSVGPIGSGRDYSQDLGRSADFRFLVDEGYVDDLVEASLRFVLGNPSVSTALVGYSSMDHLEQAVKCAAKGPLPGEALAKLPAVWGRYAGG
jgi:aryl-alcohol dehydrogenase-like predicted oxidoreductase